MTRGKRPATTSKTARRTQEFNSENRIVLTDFDTDNRIIVNRLLIAQQVATLLNVKTSTIRAWTSEGRLPHIKIGRSVRYLFQDIGRLIEEGRREAREELPHNKRTRRKAKSLERLDKAIRLLEPHKNTPFSPEQSRVLDRCLSDEERLRELVSGEADE